MTSIFILEYAEKGSNYRKSISNTFSSCRKIGEKTYVATQGGKTWFYGKIYTLALNFVELKDIVCATKKPFSLSEKNLFYTSLIFLIFTLLWVWVDNSRCPFYGEPNTNVKFQKSSNKGRWVSLRCKQGIEHRA